MPGCGCSRQRPACGCGQRCPSSSGPGLPGNGAGGCAPRQLFGVGSAHPGRAGADAAADGQRPRRIADRLRAGAGARANARRAAMPLHMRCRQPAADATLLSTFLQVPAGMLADRVGGAHLLAAGLLTWNAVGLLFSQVPASGSPFMALLAARAALGLAQSCLMPATSALSGEHAGLLLFRFRGALLEPCRPANCAHVCRLPRTPAAKWFPAATRGRLTSLCYSSYSVGTVAGLALTPRLAAVRLLQGADRLLQQWAALWLMGALPPAMLSPMPPCSAACGLASHVLSVWPRRRCCRSVWKHRSSSC